MTDHEKTLTDQTLDEALALMAEDVPPMPADFHDKWTNAVRAEAEKTQPEAAKAQPGPEKEGKNSKVIAINRWTRILSAAAVFVFLIGGTLIYRASRPSLTVVPPEKEEQKTVVQVTEKPAPAVDGAVFDMEEAAEERVEEIEAPAMGYYAEAPEADASMEATDAAMEATAEADAPMLNLSAAGTAKNKAENQKNAVQEEAAEAQEAMDAAAPVPEVHMTPDPTMAPEHATREPETQNPEKEPEPAAKAEPAGFLQRVGDFFKDMGSFLLTVWPYLLILAVPAGAALIYRRKKRNS